MSKCNEILVTEQNITGTKSANGGLYLNEKTKTYSVDLYVDFFNKRLKVLDYTLEDCDTFCQYLDAMANHYDLTKIIMVARQQDWQSLFRRGFILEALHPSFFKGEPGYHLSKFLSADRRTSLLWDEEETVLKQVFQLSPQQKSLEPGFQLRAANTEDVPALAHLYAKVFETYPTPMDNPDYIEKVMQANTHFQIIEYKGSIVSAASLDIDWHTQSAELTDCATLPEYRGQSLMTHLVSRLEKEALDLGLITVYTIARATSVGINAVFFRHGYSYYGRFVNNCEICCQLEDMNLWSKRLAVN